MSSWTRKQDPPPYETIELIVSGIIPIILTVVGTFGNLLSTIILFNKQNRRISTNIYLLFLCITDTLSLYQWNLSYIVYTLTGGKQRITDQSLFLCKSGEFLSFYTLHTSAMFLTLVSLDRACLLWSRWYKARFARAPVALIVCAITLVILFGLNGFLFGLGIEYPIYDNSTGTQMTVVGCFYSFNANLSQFFGGAYSWIHLVVMYFVPFSVMFVCTVMTVKKLVVRQIVNNEQLANSARRNRRISIMLLFMCLAYAIFTLPNRLCFSLFVDQIIGHDYTDTVFLSSNTLMYTRNALNIFFLYLSVAGFRRDVRHLMVIGYGAVRNRVVPLGNNEEKHSGTATIITLHEQRRNDNGRIV